MRVTDFIEKLKHIESLPTTYYSVSGGAWAKWNGYRWNFDCVILIKAILWGWNENKLHPHGGATYLSNGVYDDNADGIINRCTNVSSNFSKLIPGELLWMPGHVGIYIGDNTVIECTGAWERKVLYSKIDSTGKRTRNGYQVGYWKKHGKLPYLECDCEEVNTNDSSYKIGDEVSINGVYVSSSSDTMLTPAISKGTITKIVKGARNPYLLNNGTIGWINEKCIVPISVSPKVYKTVANCSYLNLRTSPSYGNNIFTTVRSGTKVEYFGVTNGWAKIIWNGKALYCGMGYLI